MKYLIHGGTILTDKGIVKKNIFINNKKIVALSDKNEDFIPDKTINADGKIIAPGIVDLSTQVFSLKDKDQINFETEINAAVSSGVVAMCCYPDTNSELDESGSIKTILQKSKIINKTRILPVAAMTKSLRGEELTEMYNLFETGCVSFSQAYKGLPRLDVLRKIFQYSKTFDLKLWFKPLMKNLRKNGVIHDGKISTKLGLVPIPYLAETIAVSTLLLFAKDTKSSIHISSLTCKASTEMIKQAKDEGIAVTCDVSINNIHLQDDDIGNFDTNLHLNSPIRAESDRKAIMEGLKTGVIDAISSDHTPLSIDKKNLPFAQTIPGASGLEFLLPLGLKWAKETGSSLDQLFDKISINPSIISGLNPNKIEVNKEATFCIFCQDHEWQVKEKDILSAGKNTPFLGKKMIGQNFFTFIEGRLVYSKEKVY